VHLAKVRVHAALTINRRCVLVGPHLSARCDRTSQGDLKLARILDRAPGDVRLSVSNGSAAMTAGTFGSGSDNLRATTKTATLRDPRFDPVCPDM
jgi:hypothetical protein